jgi:acyl-CoA thioester hydrolase
MTELANREVYASESIDIRVPFYDADPLGIAWHGHFYKYFDRARDALLRSIDYSPRQMKESGYKWPVIESRCRYAQGIDYGEQIRVEAHVVEYEFQLTIEYRIFDRESEDRMARGLTKQVAVDAETEEMCIGSPDVLLERLGVEA